jgi:hypothetical protein
MTCVTCIAIVDPAHSAHLCTSLLSDLGLHNIDSYKTAISSLFPPYTPLWLVQTV